MKRGLVVGLIWMIRIVMALFLALVLSLVTIGQEATTTAALRVRAFPGVAWHRDRQCTRADAWREALPLVVLGAEKIKTRMRVIQREDGLELLETPAGRFWVPIGDSTALAEELVEQSVDEYGAAGREVQRGEVVLDCGGSSGVFTRRALQLGASKVVTIELAPWALECLRRNLRDEIQSGRVILYPKGVWDRNAELSLNVAPGRATTAGSVALKEPAGKVVTVPVTTIDQIVEELHLERVDFIKMDIEGAEPNALRGATRTVSRFHPRMAISLEHHTTDPETIPALARQLWPDYQIECGACANMNGHLQPVVMFARPAIGY